NISPIMTMLLINLFLLIVGTFMEAIAAIVILTPILLPVVTSIGIDPTHFGIIMVANLAIGLITPPVGVSLFVGARVGNTTFEYTKDISKSYDMLYCQLIWICFYCHPSLSINTLIPIIIFQMYKIKVISPNKAMAKIKVIDAKSTLLNPTTMAKKIPMIKMIK